MIGHLEYQVLRHSDTVSRKNAKTHLLSVSIAFGSDDVIEMPKTRNGLPVSRASAPRPGRLRNPTPTVQEKIRTPIAVAIASGSLEGR